MLGKVGGLSRLHERVGMVESGNLGVGRAGRSFYNPSW